MIASTDRVGDMAAAERFVLMSRREQALISLAQPWFMQHDNARIQLQMMKKRLGTWQRYPLGDVVRAL